MLQETIQCLYITQFAGRLLQERLDQPISAPPSPRTGGRDVNQLTENIKNLRQEVARYRHMLAATKQESMYLNAAFVVTLLKFATILSNKPSFSGF